MHCFLFSPPVNSDEEVLISEEEVPFKDDPRDETYKPHLDRYLISQACETYAFSLIS